MKWISDRAISIHGISEKSDNARETKIILIDFHIQTWKKINHKGLIMNKFLPIY